MPIDAYRRGRGVIVREGDPSTTGAARRAVLNEISGLNGRGRGRGRGRCRGSPCHGFASSSVLHAHEIDGGRSLVDWEEGGRDEACDKHAYQVHQHLRRVIMYHMTII